MKYDIQGMDPSATLPAWDPILRKWFKVLDEYAAVYPATDAAYWYTERAALGMLAGAVWRSGGVVLEEYRCLRDVDGKQRKGRTDAWFNIRAECYEVEAKYVDRRTKPGKLYTVVDATLNQAARQLETSGDKESTQVALTFFIAGIKKRPELDETFSEFIEPARKLKPDLLAWYFPVSARGLLSPQNKHHYPGVILVGRLVRQGSPTSAISGK